MKNETKNIDTLGSRIKIAREERHLSQSDLAKALGFQSSTAISLIENNERGVSTDTLKGLSKILQRDLKYFLGQEEDASVGISVALRADKDLTKEDRNAILHFIDLAKNKKNGR